MKIYEGLEKEKSKKIKLKAYGTKIKMRSKYDF
jgi:hypothetical protein